MRIALVLSLSLYCFVAFSQGFKVRHNLPLFVSSATKEVFEIAPGAYFGLGISVDTTTGFARGKLNVLGLNQSGQIAWSKNYGTNKFTYYDNPYTQRCMISDGNAFYYVGHANDTNGRIVGVFIKFGFNGDTLWQRKFSSTDTLEDIIPQMVTKSRDGGFLITGLYQNSGDASRTCLILKTNANGAEIWRKKIIKTNPNVLDGRSIVQDSASKKIVISGYQNKIGQVYDNIIITDSLGNQILQKSFTSFGGMLLDHIQTSDKGIVAVGWAYSTVLVGGQPTMKPLIVKFDLNNPNSIIWKNDNIGDLLLVNGFTGICELPNNDLLVSGVVDTIVGNPNNPNSYSDNQLISFVTFSQSGQIKSNKLYNYKNVDTSKSYLQSMNSFHLCQDGGWVGAVEVFNNPKSTLFFIKYDSTGCDTSASYCQYMSTLSVGSSIYYNEIKIYPNPSNGVLKILATRGSFDELSIYNTFGQEIQKLVVGENDSITISGLPTGIYILQAAKQKGFVVLRQKVVVKD